jgi:hypothetical protein
LSYVIQNFYDFNKKVSLTPRFKFFFLLNNLEKFFIFIKINTFLKYSNKLNFNYLNTFNLFFKYFFSKQYFKLLFQLNLNLVGNYTNNITKSSIYIIFYFFEKFLNLNKIPFKFKNLLLIDKINYNLYFLPIKVLNIRINNNFYKNIFFFFMLINSFLWYQHSSTIKFYLNFIFVNYNLKSSRFFTGYFLRVYNY